MIVLTLYRRPVLGLLALGAELLRLFALQESLVLLRAGGISLSGLLSTVLFLSGVCLAGVQLLSPGSDWSFRVSSDQRVLLVVNALWLSGVFALYFSGLQYAGILR